MSEEVEMAIATVKRFLGSPRDWDGKIEELNAWTASAFLAGETDASDEQAKSELYSWLNGLRGWLLSAQCAADAALTRAGAKQ